VKTIRRIWSFLPWGVREPLAVSLVMGVIALAGSLTHTFDLYGTLVLWPAEFWRGRIWQVATYPLLPFGLADLLVNGFFFAMLGRRLVQVWGRWPFWRFCFVAVLGTAAVKLMLSPFNGGGLVGISGIVYAMLAAWYRLFANEEVCFMGVGQMRMKAAVLIIGGLNIIFGLLCPCGFWNALATLGGAVTGWLYLAAQSHWALRQDAQTMPSQRISRLEL
jgi:membrane associated rhomboid family serine protease